MAELTVKRVAASTVAKKVADLADKTELTKAAVRVEHWVHLMVRSLEV